MEDTKQGGGGIFPEQTYFLVTQECLSVCFADKLEPHPSDLCSAFGKKSETALRKMI